MTKTIIRKAPELPNARLYLDDLFEIEGILLEEYAKLKDTPPISFEYEIGGNLVLTTHEELIEHEGYTSTFQLNVASPEWRFKEQRVLVLYNILHPQFDVPSALREQRFAIREKVRQIFESRADKIRGAFEQIPVRILGPLMLVGLLLEASAWVFKLSPMIRGFACLLGFAFGTPFFVRSIVEFRFSRIYLRHARQDEKARMKARSERLEKLWFLLAGAAIATILKALLDRFTH